MTDAPHRFVTHFTRVIPALQAVRDRHWVLAVSDSLSASARAGLAEEIAVLAALGARLSIVTGPTLRADASEPIPLQEICEHNEQAARHWLNLLARGRVGVPDQMYRVRACAGNVVSATADTGDEVDAAPVIAAGQVQQVDARRVAVLQESGFVIVQTTTAIAYTGALVVLCLQALVRDYAAATEAAGVLWIGAGDTEHGAAVAPLQGIHARRVDGESDGCVLRALLGGEPGAGETAS